MNCEWMGWSEKEIWETWETKKQTLRLIAYRLQCSAVQCMSVCPLKGTAREETDI
jgi:Fe-S-cluster-containing dehydrogenase component